MTNETKEPSLGSNDLSIIIDSKLFREVLSKVSIAKLKDLESDIAKELENRAKQLDVLKQIKELAAQNHLTLAQLGYQEVDSLILDTESDAPSNKRPIKPKLKAINAESQFFYFKDDKLNLLATHTMKKSLVDSGISVFPYSKVAEADKAVADKLIAEASNRGVENYNDKVDVWNQYALANNLTDEILSKK